MPVGKIFLNYRRDDTEGYVGRLYDHLNRRFPGRIFRDVTELRPGEDFVDALAREGQSCQVLLAVIGRRWLSMTDATGRRRLDDPDDILRQEIAHALERNVLVIPVLVGGATMPLIDELPPELARLGRRQALPISELDFEHDMERLFRTLSQAFGEPTEPAAGPQLVDNGREQQPPAPPPETRKHKRLFTIVGIAVAAIALFAIVGIIGQNSNRGVPAPEANDHNTADDRQPDSSADANDDRTKSASMTAPDATRPAKPRAVANPAPKPQGTEIAAANPASAAAPETILSNSPEMPPAGSDIELRYLGDYAGCTLHISVNIGGGCSSLRPIRFMPGGCPTGTGLTRRPET